MLAVLHCTVAAQAVAPALGLCQVQAGTKAKANRNPGGPSSGCCWVPPQPWDSPWSQDSPCLLALLLLWRLAAAEHSSYVLPHGPWPQIRRGTGLGVAPTGAGFQAHREQRCRTCWSRSGQGDTVFGPVPAGPEGGRLAAWPGLVAARVQHYDAWLQDHQGSSRARGQAGNHPPLWGSRSRLSSWGQVSPKWQRGDGAGGSRGTSKSGSTVSNGDSARSSSSRRGLRTWQGVGPCWRRWQ